MALKLEVGNTYRNREGDMVTIVNIRVHRHYRYLSSGGTSYTAEGIFRLDDTPHGFDLVEECQPDAPEVEKPKPLPLCEAIIERMMHKSDPFRDSENAGMMHVSAIIEVVRDGFAALSVEDVKAAIETGSRRYGLLIDDAAQAVMRLLRKE